MVTHLIGTLKDPTYQGGALVATAVSAVGEQPLNTLIIGAAVTVLITLGRYFIDKYIEYLKYKNDKK